jgi:methionyl-tRNA formyltransferase
MPSFRRATTLPVSIASHPALPGADKSSAPHLPVRHPKTLRDTQEQAAFAALETDVAVVVAYGLILPQAVLDAPRRGCLNIHASLLPRWRGAAPIQRAIMAGDAETGVCIMQMEAGLDTGPVLLRRTIAIGTTQTASDLHDQLARLGAKAIVTALANLDTLTPEPQPDEGVTYAAKIDKAEARVDWTRPAVEIDRQIRGLSPFPGAWTMIAGKRVKLLACQLAAGAGPPGSVLSDLTIACGQGAITITALQPEGKPRMEAEAYLRGARIAPGVVLGE